MKTAMDKIMGLIDKLPESDRMAIANAYYAKPESELSSKVTKLKKVFEKLDPEEQSDFIKLIGARKMEMDSEEEGMIGVSVEIENEEEDLDPNKE